MKSQTLRVNSLKRRKFRYNKLAFAVTAVVFTPGRSKFSVVVTLFCRQNMVNNSNAQGLSSTIMTILALVITLLVSRISGEHLSTTTTAQRNDEQLEVGQNQRSGFLHEPPDLEKYQVQL